MTKAKARVSLFPVLHGVGSGLQKLPHKYKLHFAISWEKHLPYSHFPSCRSQRRPHRHPALGLY